MRCSLVLIHFRQLPGMKLLKKLLEHLDRLGVTPLERAGRQLVSIVRGAFLAQPDVQHVHQDDPVADAHDRPHRDGPDATVADTVVALERADQRLPDRGILSEIVELAPQPGLDFGRQLATYG